MRRAPARHRRFRVRRIRPGQRWAASLRLVGGGDEWAPFDPLDLLPSLVVIQSGRIHLARRAVRRRAIAGAAALHAAVGDASQSLRRLRAHDRRGDRTGIPLGCIGGLCNAAAWPRRLAKLGCLRRDGCLVRGLDRCFDRCGRVGLGTASGPRLRPCRPGGVAFGLVHRPGDWGNRSVRRVSRRGEFREEGGRGAG
jgi:hypothetical protein